MKGNVSKLVRNALLRSLPLQKRADLAKDRMKKAGEFADWICPELASPTPTNTPTSRKAGASDQPKGDDE